MPSATEQALLKESLGLLATYAWHQKVTLEPIALDVVDDTDTPGISEFVREFRIRHAIAVARSLPSIVEEIELNLSHESSLIRSEVRGAIRGRLDVPRYLARRSALPLIPRRYPVVHSQWTFRTPENVLTLLALDETRRALRDNPFKAPTAENTASSIALHWVTDRMRHRPWDDLAANGLRERLYNEVGTRIRRRQTGNDVAYQRLLDWFDEWALDLNKLGADRQDEIIKGLLAFPLGDFFWAKVFEVWCIRAISTAAESLGWQRTYGPAALHEKVPVYRYATQSGHNVVVRYQKQQPLPKGRWSYRTGDALRGIPDISLTVEGGGPPLLVDAKYRFVSTGEGFTRSDETYKMLGYAENFGLQQFRGILIFPASTNRHRILDGPGGGRLDMIAVNIDGNRESALAGLSKAIASWETILWDVSPTS